MPTHGTADPPPSALPGVQRVETLLAEGVRAAQQFGSASLQVEVVVAYLALIFLAWERVGRVEESRAAVAFRVGHFRHVPIPSY